MQTNANLPPIWDYFRSTKDMYAHRTQLLEVMITWAKQQDVQIDRGLYFDNATMDDIVKVEFCTGTQLHSGTQQNRAFHCLFAAHDREMKHRIFAQKSKPNA